MIDPAGLENLLRIRSKRRPLVGVEEFGVGIDDRAVLGDQIKLRAEGRSAVRGIGVEDAARLILGHLEEIGAVVQRRHGDREGEADQKTDEIGEESEEDACAAARRRVGIRFIFSHFSR